MIDKLFTYNGTANIKTIIVTSNEILHLLFNLIRDEVNP